MITAFNANNYAQQWFFKKAFETLAQIHPDALTKEEKELKRFLSLDGYFAHIQDLILINPVYAMIPTDEEPFIIDSNARTITIPASFNKCASVTGDDMCEIATFTVDRFYDYIDLATTNICVQWTTKSKKEGISHITLIDTDTIPGKIRFGWPLTKEMTEESGSLTFAIRFFLKNEEDGTFEYVLNTLPTAIIVREGLQIDENGDKVIIESNNNLFASFVRNSSNPSYPEAQPVTWGTPGTDLKASEKVNSSNTFEMKAQGIVTDFGHIVYNWYFKESSANTYSKIEKDDERFIISERFEEVKNHEGKRTGAEFYYEKIGELEGGNANPDNFEPAIGDLDKSKTYYERYTILTLNDKNNSEEITGEYQVGATNYVGETYCALGKNSKGEIITIPAQNQSNESLSSPCKVKTPAEITFADNLNKNKFLVGETGKESASLKIATNADDGVPLLTHIWYKSDKEIDSINMETFDPADYTKLKEASSEIVGSSYDATTPGWYFATVQSKLNRKTKTEPTDVCRVVYKPEKPVLTKMEYSPWIDTTYSNPDAYFEGDVWNTVDEEHLMTDKVASRQGDVFRLRVTTDIDNSSSKLLTDKVTYKWYVILPDAQTDLITEKYADINENGLVVAGCPIDANYLDVRCASNQTKYTYYCVITNTLANESVEFAKEDYPTYTDDNNNKISILFHIW